MQHLLDFLYEHTFDKQLYCVLPCPGGELRMTWHASSPASWQVEEHDVPRTDLLAYLTERGADLKALERELHALISAHIVVADNLLRAAHQVLGPDAVPIALHGQQELTRELRAALTPLLPPRLRLVR